MNAIAFLLCLLLALCVHLRHRLQSVFAPVGRTLFVALACLVLVACGGSELSEEEERQIRESWEEGASAWEEHIKELIRDGEYCHAVIDASKWVHMVQGQKPYDYNFYVNHYGTAQGMLEVARNGCKAETDEPKTWACAEGHSCR